MLQAVPQLLDVGVQARETLVCIAPVDIAEGDNVLAGKVDEVLAAHAANADAGDVQQIARRSEEHTSELQSRGQLVCRLLLEKKKTSAPDKFHSQASLCFRPKEGKYWIRPQ